MAPHKPRKSATTDYTTGDEVLIMSDVQEEELESDQFAIKEWPQNFPKGFSRALTPTRYSKKGLVIFSDSESGIEAIRNGGITSPVILLPSQITAQQRKSCYLSMGLPRHISNIEKIMKSFLQKAPSYEFEKLSRIITSTIARLRTEHLKGMKIHPEDKIICSMQTHCPDLELAQSHLGMPNCRNKVTKNGEWFL
ncbi:hypothetical protein TNCV_3954031 [Trichonephila clavipes]|nr:hypothetical protein TNCV_3954031 [Trichonephila clavipes]